MSLELYAEIAVIDKHTNRKRNKRSQKEKSYFMFYGRPYLHCSDPVPVYCFIVVYSDSALFDVDKFPKNDEALKQYNK